jgi:glycosyltransferase involved in cell wall biosynthesis
VLKIAQIAPLYESVPPKLYGGTERVVAYLTDELVNLGYDVTLFASGDSVSKANLVPITPHALRLHECTDSLAWHIVQLGQVLERAHEFDLLHFHTDYLHFPYTQGKNIATLTTLHGRLDLPELKPVYQQFCDLPVTSISNAQRIPLPMARWIGTVYHGLPLDLYKPGKGDGNYVAFLGRVSPEKRLDRAIEIARLANMNIRIAAKIDKADQPYYEKKIRKLLRQPHVEFLGEIGEEEKEEFLGNATALLFPIDWPEPFGMVMIESLGCGTPVVAYNCGSVPEVITHGKTGFIVETIPQAVKALNNIRGISREECRMVFEHRFSATAMAKNYVRLYEKMYAQTQQQLSWLKPVPKGVLGSKS